MTPATCRLCGHTFDADARAVVACARCESRYVTLPSDQPLARAYALSRLVLDESGSEYGLPLKRAVGALAECLRIEADKERAG